jgi:hypothetical protein
VTCALPAYDQISTIIHRLEQLAELLDPVSLVEAIVQVISEVSDPLPGNVDGLKALAQAFAAAGRDSSLVGGELRTMARHALPEVWQGDAELTASGAVRDTSDLVGLAGPAFGAVVSAIDAYADTLSQLDRRRSDLVQQLSQASRNSPHLDFFGSGIPLDPLAWAGWVDSAIGLTFGLIDVYNAFQNAAYILAGQFADAASKAAPGAAFDAGMTVTDAVVFGTATVNGSSLLGAAQLTRLAQLMTGMSAADRARLDAILRAAKSPAEQAYIVKALAAGNSLSQVVAFAGQIRGKSGTWLISHLSLAGTAGMLSYDGTALVQSTGNNCGSAAIVAARVLTDPMFAHSLTTGANGQDLSGAQFTARVAAVEAQTHDATNTLWPQSLGTTPWAMAAEMNSGAGGGAGYGVDWVDDTDPLSAHSALQQAISAVDAGYPVPVLLAPTLGGLAHGTPLHYELITAHSGGQLSIYDPEGGTITQVPDSDFLNGSMQAVDSAAPHVNAVIVPGG